MGGESDLCFRDKNRGHVRNTRSNKCPSRIKIKNSFSMIRPTYILISTGFLGENKTVSKLDTYLLLITMFLQMSVYFT